MRAILRTGGMRRRAATGFGLGLLSVYLAWNGWFLVGGRVPPSLLTGLTGLPCPTTGGTRSFLALMHGDVARSLYFNPMTVPILALLVATAVTVCRRREGQWLGRAWIAVLLVAWALKLVSPAATW